MATKGNIYKCEICGNIVEVLEEGVGVLVCCGQNMTDLRAKTKDDGKEKHVPVVKTKDSGIRVEIGEVPHPMEKEHYIQFIELIDLDGKICRKELAPGDDPAAEFCCVGKIKTVREYCSVHGLWETK